MATEKIDLTTQAENSDDISLSTQKQIKNVEAGTDPNDVAIVSQLGAGGTLAGLSDVYMATGEPNDGDILTWNAGLGKWIPGTSSPGGSSPARFSFPAGSLNIKGTAFPYFEISGTNRFGAHWDFDSTGEEPVYGQQPMPASGVGATGNITLTTYVYRTAGSNTGTVWSFGYKVYNSTDTYNDSSDTAYTFVDSGTCTLTSTNTLYKFTWTADQATVAATNGKMLLFCFKRKVSAGGDDLDADAKVLAFGIEMPV